MAILEPRDVQDLRQIVADAVAGGTKLELRGGGSRADFGAPREVQIVSLVALSGIVDYDPAELVLTVRPGTLLSNVLALVEGEGQMLAFEPWGDAASTIGGTVAAGIAGSRRVTAGSVRDHLLGVTVVSGRGEIFVAGGKVVKNVTGYDLPKLMAGSWGRLGAIAELTLKVLPRPRVTATLIADGLPAEAAYRAMARALGSHADVSAAAHLRRGVTLLRIAGFAPSVEARCAVLPDILKDHCTLRRDGEASAPLWREAMTGEALKGRVKWRAHLLPRHAAELTRRVETLGADWAMDWGGGRVWIGLDDESEDIRRIVLDLGGEATLVDAPIGMRSRVPAMHGSAPGVSALADRVRRAFDPADVFATGRFGGAA